jgi:L-ribulose-5-phosphate 3-epimerase
VSGGVGVCSWSLLPASPGDLVEKVRACGLDAVQLALDPIRRGEWNEDETFDTLGAAGIGVISGMWAPAGEDYSTIDSIARTGGIRPDETWPANLEAAKELAEICGRRGIELTTFHAGFIPHDASDPERQRMIERLREIAAIFLDTGCRVGLETGQEDAATLLETLEAVEGRAVGVNFDPANMLLYNSGDPIRALEMLADFVAQVHIKDARPSGVAGEWGDEVPAGTGDVAWEDFFGILAARLPDADLMIEREAGDDRVADIRTAAALVAAHGSGPGASRA